MAKTLHSQDADEDFDGLPELNAATMNEAIYINNGRVCIPYLWIDEKMLKWLMEQGGDIRVTINAYLEVAMENWEEQEKFFQQERKQKRKQATRKFKESAG